MNANRLLFLLGFLLFPLLLSTIKCNNAQTAKTKNEQSITNLQGKKTAITGFKDSITAIVPKITEAETKVNAAFTKAETAFNAITNVKTAVTEKLAAVKAAATEAKGAKANKETAKTKLAGATTKLTELKTAAAPVEAQKESLNAAGTEAGEGYAAAKEQLQLIIAEQKKANTAYDETTGLTFDAEDTTDSPDNRKTSLNNLKDEIKALKTEIDNSSSQQATKVMAIGDKNAEAYKKLFEANKAILEIQSLIIEADEAVNEATQTINGNAGAAADGHFYVKNNTFNYESVIPDDKKCSAEDKTKAACKAHSNCYKVDNKPVCLCYPGYTPKDAQTTECVKNSTMTCQNGSHNCHANAVCKLDNTLGIGCKCKNEFKGDGILCSNSLKSMLNIIFVLAVASIQLLF